MKVGPKSSLRPFLHRALQLVFEMELHNENLFLRNKRLQWI